MTIFTFDKTVKIVLGKPVEMFSILEELLGLFIHF